MTPLLTLREKSTDLPVVDFAVAPGVRTTFGCETPSGYWRSA
jgi:hypothetical protein